VSKRIEIERQQGSEHARATPLVSILVVVYNSQEHLQTLLESIFRLKDDDIELIVVDGGSQDGTLDYLRAHKDKIDRWLSEPDRGIYDAMNKAAALATGTFLLHLNAGDKLIEIPRTELEAAENEEVSFLSFQVELSGKGLFRPTYGLGLRFDNTLHHQGTFYRRSTFSSYDTKLRVFADFDVNQLLALSGARGFLGDQVVAFHETDGVSAQKNAQRVAEFRSVIYKNYGVATLVVAYLLGKWRGIKASLRIK
jgi:glycosyltransferase involved in cell wall biosynthesis